MLWPVKAVSDGSRAIDAPLTSLRLSPVPLPRLIDESRLGLGCPGKRLEERMYASVRKYSVDADRVEELMHRVDERFADRLAEMPGFVAYQVVDAGVDRTGEGRLFAITLCSDREAADRSAELAAEFVRDELGDIELERVEAATGEVSVNRAVSEVLEAGHA
jgi:hypothetical protein